MLTEKQIQSVREHLERAQNPVFYYDNDADGLCSYVILRKFIDRGKGVAVRSFPDLDRGYARKAAELGADYVFVLDKPVLSKEFVDSVKEQGLPIVWIDHHDVGGEDYGVEVYNSAKDGGEGEPVTYLSYKITGKKEDMWLAVVGCIADHYLPDFSEDFASGYPEFWGKGIKKPFDAYFGTEIGRIARAINFGLKDSVSNVVKLQNFLISAKNPGEVFSEGSGNYHFRKKFKEIEKKYLALLERAKECVFEDLIFFEYGGDLSISSDLSNELSHLYPEKYVAVVFKKGAISNLSLRGHGVKGILARVLEGVEGSGGGHEDAVGARINTEDLKKFKDLLQVEIGK